MTSRNQPDQDLFGRMIAKRVLQDVMSDASRIWWLKRALDFEQAKPRPGDFIGNSTPEGRQARWERLDSLARACRMKAEVADHPDDVAREIDNVLSEEAA